MRVLLAVPYYSLGTCGLFLVKALGELGHHCVIWDYRRMSRPPTVECDVVLAWTTEILNFGVNQQCKKILLYPDDTTFWERTDQSRSIDVVWNSYDRVFTVNKIDGFEWLPLGCDPDLHRKVDVPLKYDVLFIGTLRDPGRKKFIDKFRMSIPESWSFKVFGNNWDISGSSGPVYYDDFVREVCSASVVLNQHYNLGPSTKDFEIAACGGGSLLSDDVPAVREALPSVLTYSDVGDAVEKCKRLVGGSLLRKELAGRLQGEAYRYSYRKQLARVFDTLE